MLPLFFPSMQLLTWVMGFFGGDPERAGHRDGKETFPLVPVAVGLYSTAFNIFNTAAAVPVHRRVRAGAVARRAHARRGRRRLFDAALSRSRQASTSWRPACPLVQQEMARYRRGRAAVSRRSPARRSRRPATRKDHQAALDILSRDIRRYTAAMFKPDMPHARGRPAGQPDRGRGFHRQPRRNAVSRSRGASSASRSRPSASALVDATLDQIAEAMRTIAPGRTWLRPRSADGGGAAAVPAVDARAVPAAGRRAVVGGARRDPGAPRQRGACLLPDRSHRCRAPIGTASRGRPRRKRACRSSGAPVSARRPAESPKGDAS